MTADLGNVYALADVMANRRRRPRPPTSGNDSRPTVRIDPGSRPKAVDEAEAALIAKDKNVYSFGPKLVTVVWDEIRVAGGGKEKALRLSVMTEPAMLQRFDLAARFEKWNGAVGDYVECDCPREVADQYLSRDGNWKVPALLGAVTAPTLRADGTVLDRPGYDPASGLLYDPLGVDFPPIPPYPTKEGAEKALAEIKRLIEHFPFVNGTARSVALSFYLTTVARPALAAAPLHAFDAPVAGSGKSKLGDIPAIVATGHRAAAIGGGTGRHSDEELEKKLSAALLSGDQIILLDNLDAPLGGQLLCQILTQHAVKLRPFGKLQNVIVPCTAAICATGNNLVIHGDAVRRSLTCRLDPKVERPELLEFDFEPLARAKAERVSLLIGALTILRGWICAAEKPPMPTALGSFEDWSRIVRNALIWLGEDDPVEVMEETRGKDPSLARTRDLIRAWQRVLPYRSVTVRDLMAAALSERTVVDGDGNTKVDDSGKEIKIRENADLYDAVGAITTGRDPSKSLGWWLRGKTDRVFSVDGKRYRFRLDDDGKYFLDAMDEEKPPF
jgi:putative DNA primase/helicase